MFWGWTPVRVPVGPVKFPLKGGALRPRSIVRKKSCPLGTALASSEIRSQRPLKCCHQRRSFPPPRNRGRHFVVLSLTGSCLRRVSRSDNASKQSFCTHTPQLVGDETFTVYEAASTFCPPQKINRCGHLVPCLAFNTSPMPLLQTTGDLRPGGRSLVGPGHF